MLLVFFENRKRHRSIEKRRKNEDRAKFFENFYPMNKALFQSISYIQHILKIGIIPIKFAKSHWQTLSSFFNSHVNSLLLPQTTKPSPSPKIPSSSNLSHSSTHPDEFRSAYSPSNIRYALESLNLHQYQKVLYYFKHYHPIDEFQHPLYEKYIKFHLKYIMEG